MEANPYLANLVMRFESLGGTGHGCEFGIFQRNFGAEPLGLLRWADLGPDQLCAVLETEFAGVGAPENTIVFVPQMDGQLPEYWTRDRRHHMAMRCFVSPKDIPEENMVKLVERRLRFLSRKIIADLKSCDKIFVYKNMRANLSADSLDRLYRAVRKYGDTTLLYVRYADEDHTPGTVEISDFPGLMIAYTSRFTHTPETDEFLGETDEIFLELSNQALRLWYSGRTNSKCFWNGEKRIFIVKNHMRTGIFYRSGFTLGELAVEDRSIDGDRLVEVHSEVCDGRMVWNWRSGNQWLDPGMNTVGLKLGEENVHA